MKKVMTFVICIAVFIIAGNTMIFAQKEKPEVFVEVNPDGSVTVALDPEWGDYSVYDLVCIYKETDVITPGMLDLVHWYPWQGRTVTYPGGDGYPIDTSGRPEELSNGMNSALLPGKYYVVILGKLDKIIADPVYFEIPEITATPTPELTPTQVPETPEPTPKPTAAPTESPAPEKTPARTASPMATVTPAATPEATPHTTGRGGKAALWICLGAAALAAAGITAIVLVRKKKTKK